MNNTFYPFPRLPVELRIMIWSYLVKIPYDHVLLVHLRRDVIYQKGTKPYGKKAIRAHIAYNYHITNCSWPIDLLGVNQEAREQALAANPQSLQINNGPIVYFNAHNNIIHFDYQGLHVLRNCQVNRQHPERVLKGFHNIVNLSITGGCTRIVSQLRNIALPAQVAPLPAYSPLSGVTFVQTNHWAAGTHNFLHPYQVVIVAQYNRLEVNTTHPKQKDLIVHRRLLDIYYVDNFPGAYFEAVTWSVLPGKGQGVRAPEQ